MVNSNNGVGLLTGSNSGTGRLSFPSPLTAVHRCDVCGKMLSTKLTLKRHKEQQHLQPLNNAVCNLCNKVFRTLNSLNNHKSIYHRRQKHHTHTGAHHPHHHHQQQVPQQQPPPLPHHHSQNQAHNRHSPPPTTDRQSQQQLQSNANHLHSNIMHNLTNNSQSPSDLSHANKSCTDFLWMRYDAIQMSFLDYPASAFRLD